MPLPHCSYVSPTRRAVAGVTETMFRSNRFSTAAILAPTRIRSEQISTAASVPAEIRISSSASSAAMQASAPGSSRAIAISAEVSNAITWDDHLGRSPGQAVLVIEEILAARGAGAGRGVDRSLTQLLQQRPARFSVQAFLDRDQPHRRMAMPGQNDFVARFGAAHQLG